MGPQKSRQNGQLALESGGTSESGGTCPLLQRRTAPVSLQLQYYEDCISHFANLVSEMANPDEVEKQLLKVDLIW